MQSRNNFHSVYREAERDPRRIGCDMSISHTNPWWICRCMPPDFVRVCYDFFSFHKTYNCVVSSLERRGIRCQVLPTRPSDGYWIHTVPCKPATMPTHP